MKLLKSKKKFLVHSGRRLAVTGGTALAVVSTSAGGSQVQMLNRVTTSASVTSSTMFSDVPGATAWWAFRRARTRLINARFTAESIAPGRSSRPRRRVLDPDRGPAHRWGDGRAEPAGGSDYAFDTVASDGQEGHAMERSIRLGAGTYVIRAQRAVTSNAVSFRLDDWHLAVEESA